MSKLVNVLTVLSCCLVILPSQAVPAVPDSSVAHAQSHYERPVTTGGPYKERVIVFVHGIFGDADGTWRYSPSVYWPSLLLADDAFRDSDVYVASYPTPYLGNTMTVDEVVTNLNNRLISDGIFSKHREVIFVCHSLGGLVIQRLLLTFREYARQVPLIYFYSTPETGAQIAKLGNVFSADPLLKEMFPGDSNDYLLNLENEWRAAQFHIHRFCAYEKKKYRGVLVVDRLSSTRSCDEPPIAVNEDHVGIVKPNSTEHDSYIALRNAVIANPVSHRTPSANSPPTQASLEFTHTAAVKWIPGDELFPPDYPLDVHVVYANTKGGIAREVFANCSLFLFSGSVLKGGTDGVKSQENEKWNTVRQAWLSNIASEILGDNDIAGFDKTHYCIASTHRPLRADESQRLRDQIDVVYVMAAVKWRDGTGQYESDICTFFLPKEKTNDPLRPAQWRACISGHNATRKLLDLSPAPMSAQRKAQSLSRSLFAGNTYENLPNSLEVTDPGTIFKNNTVRNMDAKVSNGAYADNNSFEGRNTAGHKAESPADDGNGANMAAIHAAQTQNQYVCINPCGSPGPIPDYAVVTALQGSNVTVADRLSEFINDAHKIVAEFSKDDNAQLLSEKEKSWEAEVRSILTVDLGQSFVDQFNSATSASTAYPPGHNAQGGSICNLIDGKIAALSSFVNKLRAADH